MTALFESNGIDSLGLWQPTVSTAGATAGAVSFSLGEDPAPEPAQPVFRINLPADGESATQALAEQEAYLHNLNAALENVPMRLDGLVARTLERQQKSASGSISFDTSEFDQPETGPEGELLTLLGDVEAEEKAQNGEVSFGLQETTSAALEQAKAGFKALMEQIDHEVLHFAWVETNIAGQLLARTSIGWAGDAETALANGLMNPQLSQHSRSLRIVTQTRSIRIRLFVTIASGAAKVSALLATPTGSVLAIPAVYQYVMKIVAQVKQLQSIQSA